MRRTTSVAFRRRSGGQGGASIGHLVPGPPVEVAAPGLRTDTAPLLEEERDAAGVAAIAKVPEPLRADGTVPRTGLAAGDQPVDAVESRPSSGPSSGSAEMNRTAAGTSRRRSAR